MQLNVDYSQVQNQVKAGHYPAVIRLIGEHTSKKGTRCAKITFQIVGGEFDGRNVPLTFPLEGKAAGFIRDVIRSAIPSYAEGSIECEELLGKQVKLEVLETKKIEGERSYLKIFVHPLEAGNDVADDAGAE